MKSETIYCDNSIMEQIISQASGMPKKSDGHTENVSPSEPVKDKPDFNALANEFLDQYTKDYPPGKQKCYRSGCERIWNDYYLPALKRELAYQKRIEELESKLK